MMWFGHMMMERVRTRYPKMPRAEGRHLAKDLRDASKARTRVDESTPLPWREPMTSDHFKAIRTAVVLFPLVAIVSLVVLSLAAFHLIRETLTINKKTSRFFDAKIETREANREAPQISDDGRDGSERIFPATEPSIALEEIRHHTS